MNRDQNKKDYIMTSLGVPLYSKQEGKWILDVSHMKLFTGLSVMARMICEEIREQLKNGESDIIIKRKVYSEMNPELLDIGINSVVIYARGSLLKKIPVFSQEFQDQIRSVFGTFQRPRWGSFIFPEFFDEESLEFFRQNDPLHIEKISRTRSKGDLPALLFPFQEDETEHKSYYFLVEREVDEGLLRVTIDDKKDPIINLNGIDHNIVDDLARRTFVQGLTSFTEAIYLGIRRESENNRSVFYETIRHQSEFFKQLAKAGLNNCESITIIWPPEMSMYMLEHDPGTIKANLKKALLPVEDGEIVNRLNDGDTIIIENINRKIYLDLSRKGRNLNISLGRERKAHSIEYYLDRMPLLKEWSEKRREIFNGYRVFLIHHITSEILALIKALETAGTNFLNVLFVKYAGIVPVDYQETLHTMPEERFVFAGLHRVETEESVEGYYILSTQYSQFEKFQAIDNYLREKKLTYFDAMVAVSLYIFILEVVVARRSGVQLLLIEDGGYLSPLINAYCLEGRTVKEVVNYFNDCTDKLTVTFLESIINEGEINSDFKNWISNAFPGSIEHTKNGYDRMLNVQEKHGQLGFPAFSIAVSDSKRNEESREVAVTILHAVESILHGLGRVLSRRRVLVLGSRGAIGSRLVEYTVPRIGPENVCGVDIAIGDSSTNYGIVEVFDLQSIDKEILYDIDLFIGVIGKSIITEDQFGKILSNSARQELFFASGSTKTVEFTHVQNMMDNLIRGEKKHIEEREVLVSTEILRDPQSDMELGSIVNVTFIDDKTSKRVFLLAGLTPINFLFYGVPTESMDSVLTQLFRVSTGYIENMENVTYENSMHAVDIHIDDDAKYLTSKD